MQSVVPLAIIATVAVLGGFGCAAGGVQPGAVDAGSGKDSANGKDRMARGAEHKAETEMDDELRCIQTWLGQFENNRKGRLPETFRVRLSFHNYYSRETEKGTLFLQPREVYEFTPTEVRRLLLRAVGVDEEGETEYWVDGDGHLVHVIANRKPFKRIDDVCRILQALDFVGLTGPDESARGENFHHLQVMTDTGLEPMGSACIRVGASDVEASIWESCLGAGFDTSAQSIRFAALYHTLRRTARGALGLCDDDWRDAMDIIDVNGSIRPAQGTLRAD
jgi:hypothetical protein